MNADLLEYAQLLAYARDRPKECAAQLLEYAYKQEHPIQRRPRPPEAPAPSKTKKKKQVDPPPPPLLGDKLDEQLDAEDTPVNRRIVSTLNLLAERAFQRQHIERARRRLLREVDQISDDDWPLPEPVRGRTGSGYNYWRDYWRENFRKLNGRVSE